jgi:hypothetical protein
MQCHYGEISVNSKADRREGKWSYSYRQKRMPSLTMVIAINASTNINPTFCDTSTQSGDTGLPVSNYQR